MSDLTERFETRGNLAPVMMKPVPSSKVFSSSVRSKMLEIVSRRSTPTIMLKKDIVIYLKGVSSGQS